MVSGFLSALDSFGQCMSKETINQMTIGNELFIFQTFEETGLKVVCKTNSKVKDKFIRLSIKKIYDKFLERYPKENHNFNNVIEIGIFVKFDKVIEEIFSNNINKTIGMW